jgi:hypothetical protein
MVLGRPYNLTISSKTRLATLEALEVLEHRMKWAILENLSTTTKIESCFLRVQGRPRTKSMLISSQGQFGIGKGV